VAAVKIYATVDPVHSRAIHRVNAELQNHAPDGVEFVMDPRAADLQILHVVGSLEFNQLVHPRYVLFIHCYWRAYEPFWASILRDAALVVSTYDLGGVASRERFPFRRAPYGVDGSVFYDRQLPRDRIVLTTGYATDLEPIAECREAAMAAGDRAPHLIQVGAPFWQDGSAELHEGVSDDELAALYSRSHYVSGLRRKEGFELPVLEGLACGARPVCFDDSGYRHWYDGHAVFVAEQPPAELVRELTSVFSQVPNPVTQAEREEILERFSWSVICADLWREICERVHASSMNGQARQPDARGVTFPSRFRLLELEETDDGFAIQDRERASVHHLNATAAAVFELCDGSRDLHAIADVLAELYDLPSAPVGETLAGLRDLADRQLIYWDGSMPVDLSFLQAVDPELLRMLVMGRPWFHQIDLGHGIVTPGIDRSAEKLEKLGLPQDLSGKTVLDIGAYDGFFSFAAERRGAARVVAADHFLWTKPEGIGDGRGFDIAHWALGSRVEKKVIPVEAISPETVGVFDYVLLMGVLYHSQDPLRYLRNAFAVCRGTTIVETHVDGLDYDRPMMVYYPGDTLNSDPTNFWGPNRQCVFEMLYECGYARVDLVDESGDRMTFHAHRTADQST
jgi:tRNA (mo5U34)-methyltransferase